MKSGLFSLLLPPAVVLGLLLACIWIACRGGWLWDLARIWVENLLYKQF